MEVLYAGQAVVAARLMRPQETAELVGLLEQIADEQGWQPGERIREHSARSVHLALLTGGGIAGGLQLALPAPDCRLPCCEVWPELAIEGERAAHVTVLALSAPLRGKPMLLWLLCTELWRYCREQGISELWLEVTPRNLALYRRLGWPLQVKGSLRLHWGEECVLCRLDLVELARVFLARAERSSTYREIVAHARRKG